MSTETRSARIIALEIQQLNEAKRAGHLSDAAFEGALRALSAELAATSAGGTSDAKIHAPPVVPPVRPAGGMRLDCPTCHAPGVYLICLKCREARSFTFLADGNARCSCGSVIGSAKCTCGMDLLPRSFRLVKPEEVPTLNGESQRGTPAPDALKKAWDGWPGCLAFIAIIVCIGVCKGGGSGSSSAAHDAVLARLKAPSTADFVETKSYGSGRYYVAVDAENGFGAKIRSTFCVALKGSDPNAPDQEQVFECSKAEAAMLFAK